MFRENPERTSEALSAARARATWLVALALIACTSMSLGAAELKLLSSFNTTQRPTYAVLERYLDNVGKLGGDAVTITVSGPETVSIFEQLQPVSMGVFDMLYTHPVFHAGSQGLALAFDAISVDPVARRESGAWDYIDEYYQETHNLKMVALMSVSMEGYHLFTKEPLTADSDLAGRKIRGTPTYHGVIRALGAEPVVLPGSEIYSALQRGIVEGAGWPAAGMVDMKHYEVANYRLRPTFGAATQPVFVNLDAWGELDDEERGVLLEAGRLSELEVPWLGNRIQADEDEKLDELGVEVEELSPEKAKLVQTVFIESIWELARENSGDAADELRDIALEAGITQ